MKQTTQALAAALLLIFAGVAAAQPPPPIDDTGIDKVTIRYLDQAEREGPVDSRLNQK